MFAQPTEQLENSSENHKIAHRLCAQLFHRTVIIFCKLLRESVQSHSHNIDITPSHLGCTSHKSHTSKAQSNHNLIQPRTGPPSNDTQINTHTRCDTETQRMGWGSRPKSILQCIVDERQSICIEYYIRWLCLWDRTIWCDFWVGFCSGSTGRISRSDAPLATDELRLTRGWSLQMGDSSAWWFVCDSRAGPKRIGIGNVLCIKLFCYEPHNNLVMSALHSSKKLFARKK